MLDIGLSKKERKLISDALSCILSDKILLFFKMKSFTWNIKGECAYNYQLLFDEQSKELLNIINIIAYRIRALDYYVPATLRDYLHLTGLAESKLHTHESHDMLKALIMDNEFLVRRCSDVYEIATTVNDPVTRNLMQERMKVHSENAWKMRIHLE